MQEIKLITANTKIINIHMGQNVTDHQPESFYQYAWSLQRHPLLTAFNTTNLPFPQKSPVSEPLKKPKLSQLERNIPKNHWDAPATSAKLQQHRPPCKTGATPTACQSALSCSRTVGAPGIRHSNGHTPLQTDQIAMSQTSTNAKDPHSGAAKLQGSFGPTAATQMPTQH